MREGHAFEVKVLQHVDRCRAGVQALPPAPADDDIRQLHGRLSLMLTQVECIGQGEIRSPRPGTRAQALGALMRATIAAPPAALSRDRVRSKGHQPVAWTGKLAGVHMEAEASQAAESEAQAQEAARRNAG